MSKVKLYSLLLIACTAGYIWVFLLSARPSFLGNQSMEVCLIKHTTDLPCPSCGSSRALLSLLNGEFLASFLYNPLGYLIGLIMLVAPLWIVYDVVRKKDSLYRFYYRLENGLKKPYLAIPLVLLILINWFWNITKGL